MARNLDVKWVILAIVWIREIFGKRMGKYAEWEKRKEVKTRWIKLEGICSSS